MDLEKFEIKNPLKAHLRRNSARRSYKLFSSLNVAQRLSQLYIILRMPFAPERLFKMGVRENSKCPRCSKDHGDLSYIYTGQGFLILLIGYSRSTSRRTLNYVYKVFWMTSQLGLILNRPLIELSFRPISLFLDIERQLTLPQ